MANHNSIVDVISDWLLKVHIPHMGGVRGRLKTCNDMFTHITQLLNTDDLDPAEQRVLQKIIPDLVSDFRALPETFEDIDMGPLAGFRPMVDVKTLACNGSYQGSNVNPVETRQSRAAAEYTCRAKRHRCQTREPRGRRGRQGRRDEDVWLTAGAGARPGGWGLR